MWDEMALWTKEDRHEFYRRNREAQLARQREARLRDRLDNPEKYAVQPSRRPASEDQARRNRDRNREWYIRNRAGQSAYHHEYYLRHREAILEEARLVTATASARRRKAEYRAVRDQLTNAQAVRRGAAWTPEEDAILLQGNLTAVEAALVLGRSYHSVGTRVRRLRRKASLAAEVA